MERRALLRGALIGMGGLISGCRPPGRLVPTIYVRGSTLPPPTPTPTPKVRSAAALTPPIPTSVPITSLDDLYLNSYRTTPTPDALAAWSLTIDGLVARPLTLTMDDMRALPPVESMRTLACISNPVGGALIGNLVWTGVDIAPILARAGVQPGAAFANFEAVDGYTTSVAITWITQPGVLLVYLANGEPLPPEHGYPLRLLMPGLYGQKMPKWITRITFAAQERLGYWEQEFRGWSNLATVRTISQVRDPSRNLPYTDTLRLAGLAYAGHEAITQIEVAIRTDKAAARAWQPTTLIRPPSPLAWTWWVYDWSPPAPGLYHIAVRATDETGFFQARESNSTFAGAFPDGTDALHEINLLLT